MYTYLCSNLHPANAFPNYVAAFFVSDFVMELKRQPISRDSATEDDKQGESQAGLPLALAMEPPRSNGSKEQVDPSRGSDSSSDSGSCDSSGSEDEVTAKEGCQSQVERSGH